MRSHGYPFRRPSGLPPFGRRVDRISAEGWGDGSHPPRWQRTPHDLDRPPLVPSRGGRNGHPTDRCSCCSSGTVGRPTSTRFDQMVPVSSRSRIRPTSTRPTPTWVRGRASKEPRRVGARLPATNGAHSSSWTGTSISGSNPHSRGSGDDASEIGGGLGRAPPQLDDVMIAGRRRDSSVSVTLRLAHALQLTYFSSSVTVNRRSTGWRA